MRDEKPRHGWLWLQAADTGVARLHPLHPQQQPSSRKIGPKGCLVAVSGHARRPTDSAGCDPKPPSPNRHSLSPFRHDREVTAFEFRRRDNCICNTARATLSDSTTANRRSKRRHHARVGRKIACNSHVGRGCDIITPIGGLQMGGSRSTRGRVSDESSIDP